MEEKLYRSLEKIQAKEQEVYTKNAVLYASADEGKVSSDKEGVNKLDKDTVLRLLLTGALVVVSDAYYVPTKFSVTGAYVTIECAGDGTTGITVYSSEKAE